MSLEQLHLLLERSTLRLRVRQLPRASHSLSCESSHLCVQLGELNVLTESWC